MRIANTHRGEYQPGNGTMHCADIVTTPAPCECGDTRYRMATLELTAGIDPLHLGPGEDGVALTVCYQGAPVGFAMRAIPAAARSQPIDPGSFIDAEMADRAVARAIRAEVLPQRMPHGSTPLSLSVVICTRQRPEYLERCLAALEAMDRSVESDLERLEILVIDNAPVDGSARQVVARHPGVGYIVEPRPGLNFARNRALREATGGVVAYIDDDVVVDAGWLRGLVSAWSEDPDVRLMIGLVLPLEIASPAQLLFEQRGGFRRGLERERYRDTRECDPLYPCTASFLGTGANMAVGRRAALAIGGFDTALDTGAPLPGGGDLDMFYRLIRAGCRAVYDPGYLVRHQHRRDLDGLRRQYRDSWGKSFAAFVVKSWCSDPSQRGKWSVLVLAWFIKQLVHLGMSLCGRHVRPAGLIVNEIWGALLGFAGGYGRSRRRIARIESNRC